MTVRAQEQVQCYSDSDVCSNDTVQPTLLTVEECCRGDGISFYNITEGACRVCIGQSVLAFKVLLPPYTLIMQCDEVLVLYFCCRLQFLDSTRHRSLLQNEDKSTRFRLTTLRGVVLVPLFLVSILKLRKLQQVCACVCVMHDIVVAR